MGNLMMPIFAIDSQTLAVGAVVGVAVLGVVYFAVRFWLVSTRPPAIGDVRTPNLDRLNQEALERMGEATSQEGIEEAETDDDVPQALQRVISDPEA